jgi:NADH-quinone oxidoreductase subunit J
MAELLGNSAEWHALLRDGAFYGLAVLMLVGGFLSVTLPKIFHAVLAFLGVLLCTGLLFLLLGAELPALAMGMVYLGGVMVLVLYAVLLTTQLGESMPRPRWTAVWTALIASGLAFAALKPAMDAAAARGMGLEPSPGFGSLKAIGSRLLDPGPQGMILPFEAITFLLLAALVGALAVAKGVSAASIRKAHGNGHTGNNGNYANNANTSTSNTHNTNTNSPSVGGQP